MGLVARLAYVEIESLDFDRWEVFARDVFACELVEKTEQHLRFRIDDRSWRIQISQGSAEDITVLGLEVDHEVNFLQVCENLEKNKVIFELATQAQCKERGVYKMCRFLDPQGMQVEVVCGSLERPQTPYVAPLAHTGFVSADQGLGHVLLVSEQPQVMQQFYCDVLGFAVSDYVITENYGGIRGEFVFLHCNPRHHTLAFGALPIPRKLGHLMLQVKNIDDLGRTLDRVLENGFKQTRSIGRHVNDHMLSFYCESPSGLQFECGWGGVELNEGNKGIRLFEVTSVWGHQHLNIK